MRRLGIVLLVFLVSASVVGAVSFPETDSIGSADPADISDDIRVEVPHASGATADQISSSAGNYTVEISTGDDSSKTYYVSREIITPYEFTDTVVLTVDGSQTAFTQEQQLSRNWTTFEASGSDITVTYVPASTAGDGGLLDRLHFIFLENSVAILLSLLVGAGLLFGGIAWYLRSPSNIEWQS